MPALCKGHDLNWNGGKHSLFYTTVCSPLGTFYARPSECYSASRRPTETALNGSEDNKGSAIYTYITVTQLKH